MKPEESNKLLCLFSDSLINVCISYHHPHKGLVREFALAIYTDTKDSKCYADFSTFSRVCLEHIEPDDITVLRRIENWWEDFT